MKLRNKKTGEIREIKEILIDGMFNVNSLAELNEEWEDYEEPKEYWYVSDNGYVCTHMDDGDSWDEHRKEVGNYFETREEAEKAVEKLKAWKRLKDKQFKFYGWNKGSLLKQTPNNITFACDDTKIWSWEDIRDDLDLLFGGEE